VADARAALAHGHIAAHLQPGIDAGTGFITCADAVPRWNKPGAGWLPPDVVRLVLERAGLLAEVVDMALEASCAGMVACAADGFEVEATVQLAPESLGDTALADRVSHTAREHGADPRRMTFALDERALRNAPASALDVLTRLRVKGFGVAIDNVGSTTGPAEQFRRFPVTQARLAPVLVAGAGKDTRRADVLETVAEVARTLEVDLVGNGCESEDDLRLLLELGCVRVLGPFIAPPMPGAELPAWVGAWHPARLGGERE
jgi:EAL domain-containing protein (putative c-di-GMP-specific phosphodiesterase class I)